MRGDACRFCYVEGTLLGHIMDPRADWPVVGAPPGDTIVAEECTGAEHFATLSMLHGEGVEGLLRSQSMTFHCVRVSTDDFDVSFPGSATRP